MRPVTERQQAVLQFLESHISEHSYPPTMREIGEHFGISSKGAHDHITALKRKGCLKTVENRSRVIELVGKSHPAPASVEVPILGFVAAGKPIFADENFEESVHVPHSIVRDKKCFVLRVRGDSMQNAGIIEGDLAVIEQQITANDGDIVVAMIEDAVTLKRFFREKGRIRLAPENPAYSPIYSQDVRILGKLCGLVRNYQ